MDSFSNKLNSKLPLCYLHLNAADLTMWNFLSTQPAVTDTHLLFSAAARPHFDYFFSLIDFFGTAAADLAHIDEPEFKRQLASRSADFLDPSKAAAVLPDFFKNFSGNVTLIRSAGYDAPAGLPITSRIELIDVEIFGNVEPVWLKLMRQLSQPADLFLLALGPEKFLIGPRLKLKFGKPVIDVGQPPATPPPSRLKELAKKILYR